jgi:hypothetical protein
MSTAPRPRRRCTAITRAGKSCSAAPVGATNRCLLHTGNNPSLMGMIGGKRRTVFSPEGLVQFAPPQSATDLLPMIGATIIELREARLEAKLAQAFSGLVNAFLSTLEVCDLDTRIKALEARHESRK